MTTPVAREWIRLWKTLRRAVAAGSEAVSPTLNWSEFLAPYQSAPLPLFSEGFMQRWGGETWKPTADDRKAAGQLHTQIASRITTQRLDYLDGVEKTALDSVYALFQKTRDITDKFPDCRHFDALAWEVLNTRVRPFTAKWHRQSEQGALSALDSTDEFRADLTDLQPVLQRFDALLIHLRDERAAPRADVAPPMRHREISDEMKRETRWGILHDSRDNGGLEPDTADDINAAERQAIEARRRHYQQTHGVDPLKPHAVGLALSGGGIRSATFGLGVLVALAKRGILPHVDYLSTVSGGGYLGSFLSAFLESPQGGDVGLEPTQMPFSRGNGESAPLRHIRHQSKYLASGSWWQRTQMMAAQLYGMLLNAAAILYLVTCIVAVERLIRSLALFDGKRAFLTTAAAVFLGLSAVAALAILRFSSRYRRFADRLIAASAGVLLLVVGWYQLPALRAWVRYPPSIAWTRLSLDEEALLAIAGAIPLLSSALHALFGHRFRRAKLLLVYAAAIAVPVFLSGAYFAIYNSVDATDVVMLPIFGQTSTTTALWAIVLIGLVVYVFLFDVNATSPHRHYRDKLAGAYLIQPHSRPTAAQPFATGVSVLLSSLGQSERAPYHLINCALNVPGSKNPKMQGRLTDFFLFSARYCGSPLTGYLPTRRWEAKDNHLDLGTAMAISGAAAAPQMGLGTMRHWSFWLALLNVRLGYWVANPAKRRIVKAPGLKALLREMLGNMHEDLPWLNVSDGGHIENLGIYELLRRCKYIIAIDGEEDAKMTFHGLTNLQRMAAIDFGIRIDLDLDDLRLNDKGLSRSHFRFCRIHYPPTAGCPQPIGYLLYVKLSLTGNEGEFIRRYRLDEPVFPHHSTADQLFSEAQFEAYRSLGEHVGDKLFLRPLVGRLGESANVSVEKLFRRLGTGLLEPL